MAWKKKQMGVVIVISVLSKMIRPSQLIKEKLINPVVGHRLNGGIVILFEMNMSYHCKECTIVFCDEDFEGFELYAVPTEIMIYLQEMILFMEKEFQNFVWIDPMYWNIGTCKETAES